jgi:hypothetical protein
VNDVFDNLPPLTIPQANVIAATIDSDAPFSELADLVGIPLGVFMDHLAHPNVQAHLAHARRMTEQRTRARLAEAAHTAIVALERIAEDPTTQGAYTDPAHLAFVTERRRAAIALLRAFAHPTPRRRRNPETSGAGVSPAHESHIGAGVSPAHESHSGAGISPAHESHSGAGISPARDVAPANSDPSRVHEHAMSPTPSTPAAQPAPQPDIETIKTLVATVESPAPDHAPPPMAHNHAHDPSGAFNAAKPPTRPTLHGRPPADSERPRITPNHAAASPRPPP